MIMSGGLYREVQKMNESKTRRFKFFLPKRKVSEYEIKQRQSRSIIRTIKTTHTHHTPNQTPVSEKPKTSSKNLLYTNCLKFFSGFTSSHLIRKKLGCQRIIQELQRSVSDFETYGGFFTNNDNWKINPISEMNLVDVSWTGGFQFEPECLLGVGGQGCVFLGRFVDQGLTTDYFNKSFAFKIRQRTKAAINSGTSSSPGRRKSPSFKIVDGRILQAEENERNFIDDTQQEALHREAVAAFRVFAETSMKPKPLLYGYNPKLDFEIFVMEIMDFTLSDFIKGSTWKMRMDCLGDVWKMVKDGFDNCSQSGIVHYDIKPENIGMSVTSGSLQTGFLDYGISKTQAYSLDKFIRGAKVHRAPGTVTCMSPRTHLWKPMSWMDDFLTSFFSMYTYATSEGKSSFEKLSNVTRYNSNLTSESRKHMSAESLAIHCLRNPPWNRFPYGSIQALKKKQNESIVKEEVSLAMLKIHSITNPKTLDDIVSIILNIDGFLDDTMDMQGITDESARGGFSTRAAQMLQTTLAKQMGKFQVWWLEFAMEARRLVDQFWEATDDSYKEKSYNQISKLLKSHLPNSEDIEGLINDSSYGRKIIEANFE